MVTNEAVDEDVGTDQALWETVSRVVRARRSNLRIDPERPVPPALQPEDQIVALVYLGWPAGDAPSRQRRPPMVTLVDR